MSDLLECLIQIKALGETLSYAESVEQVKEPVPGAAQGGPEPFNIVWRRLAEAERLYAAALGTCEGGQLVWAGPEAAEQPGRAAFVERRRANLAVLQNCTAAQLGSLVEWPGRPSTSVADLVAIMLAGDTEVMSELRRLVPSRWRLPPSP